VIFAARTAARFTEESATRSRGKRQARAEKPTASPLSLFYRPIRLGGGRGGRAMIPRREIIAFADTQFATRRQHAISLDSRAFVSITLSDRPRRLFQRMKRGAGERRRRALSVANACECRRKSSTAAETRAPGERERVRPVFSLSFFFPFSLSPLPSSLFPPIAPLTAACGKKLSSLFRG